MIVRALPEYTEAGELSGFFFGACMTVITFDPAAFRVLFPPFADPTAFPDLRLDANFGLATGYVSPVVYGSMPEAARSYALQLMTAHLLALSVLLSTTGGVGGVVAASKVGDVQVTLSPPPFGSNSWRYWLSLSPYGLQLLALLQSQAAGGFYIGGLPERAAFRKVAGIF